MTLTSHDREKRKGKDADVKLLRKGEREGARGDAKRTSAVAQ